MHTHTHTHTRGGLPFDLLSLDGPQTPCKGHISLVVTGKSQRVSHLAAYTIIGSNLESQVIRNIAGGESRGNEPLNNSLRCQRDL